MKVVGCLVVFAFVGLVVAQLDPYPLNSTVQQAISNVKAAPTPSPTGLTKQDYLNTISSIVSFFINCQDSTGRIIDPYAKAEIQYSTPTYAHASSVLYTVTGNKTTLESAIAALNVSLEELVTGTCADGHSNFFTLPVMLAIEALQPYVPASLVEYWLAQASKISTNNYINLSSNWGLVATGGEFLRYLHGLTNMTWIEDRLQTQIPQIDSAGMFLDPTPITNPPMPYDIFPRHYLEVMLYRGYNGTYLPILTELLDRGSYSSLLMQSPLGELPTGGRSSQHQWNEAVQCVIYELRAILHKRNGDMVMASAFKRAARLAHQSVRRWFQTYGDLFIVKNRFPPELRFGYEDYSFLTNYNNLPASMLAMAYTFADDSITEGPSFAETGGFVFAVPEHHKIFANVQGNYLEIETCANPEYDATGLTRVHHPAVEGLLGPTAGSPEQNGARAIGISWSKGNFSEALAAFGTGTMTTANLNASEANITPSLVSFSVSYPLNSSKLGVTEVLEEYVVTPSSISVSYSLPQGGDFDAINFIFPVFLYDGETNTTFSVEGSSIVVDNSQTFTSSNGNTLSYVNNEVISRNGYLGVATTSTTQTSGSIQITFP